MKKLILRGLVACVWTASAMADWSPGDPAKWVQLPQMVNGYDVLSMNGVYPSPPGIPVNKAVADDWQCNDPHPVTDIHLWGSWWQDQPPTPASWTPMFRLGISSDIPAGPNPEDFSRPGKELWTVTQQPTVRLWGTGVEQFFDPNNVLPLSAETQVWQYNFILAPADYFEQTPGTIYWLTVQALNPPAGHVWGWKTSDTQWNDDAAWTDAGFSWNELKNPADPTKSLDMAFVITIPEPGTATLMGVLAGLALAVRRLLLR
jgi:hypothetical protein